MTTLIDADADAGDGVRVRHVRIADAGHYPVEQNPSAVNPALIEFLTAHPNP